MSELFPCPFCAGIDLEEGSLSSGHGESTPYVHCRSCDARMEDWAGNHKQKWNMRKYKALLDAKIMEQANALTKALKFIPHTAAPNDRYNCDPKICPCCITEKCLGLPSTRPQEQK